MTRSKRRKKPTQFPPNRRSPKHSAPPAIVQLLTHLGRRPVVVPATCVRTGGWKVPWCGTLPPLVREREQKDHWLSMTLGFLRILIQSGPQAHSIGFWGSKSSLHQPQHPPVYNPTQPTGLRSPGPRACQRLHARASAGPPSQPWLPYTPSH